MWLWGLVCALLALVNAYSALSTAQDAPYLTTLNLAYPLWLRVALAAFWAVVFLGLSVGLLHRRRAIRRWLAPLLVLYGLQSVVWLLVFARSDFGRGRIAFQAALTALLLVLASISAWWRRFRRR